MKKNKNRMIHALIMGLSLFIITSGAAAAENKAIAVLGFINQGDKTGDSINLTVTKSMVTFLSKIPGLQMAPEKSVVKVVKEKNLLGSEKVDAQSATDAGLQLQAKQIIIGDYKVNKKKNRVTINVYVYDTATMELKLKRQYEGDTGTDIFDTVDNMIRTTSSFIAGRTITTGKLKVDIDAEGSYRLYINAYPQKDIKKGDGFLDTIVAGENVEISIRRLDNDREKVVYNELVQVKENDTYTIKYVPKQEKRLLSFPVKAMQGGLGGSVGIGYLVLDFMRITIMGGAVYAFNTVVPVAEADIAYVYGFSPVLNAYASLGGFSYFGKSMLISPSLMLGVEWYGVFIEAGARYSLADSGGIKPLVGIGFRF